MPRSKQPEILSSAGELEKYDLPELALPPNWRRSRDTVNASLGIKRDGYGLVRGLGTKQLDQDGQLKQFRGYFDHLGRDSHLVAAVQGVPPRGKKEKRAKTYVGGSPQQNWYRERAFARLAITQEENEATNLHRLPGSAYVPRGASYSDQLTTERREFQAISDEIIRNRVLLRLVLQSFSCIPAEIRAPNPLWEAGIHLIRVGVKGRMPIAMPTPEGAHQDGHDFVSISIIGRSNVKGGRNLILPADHKEKYPRANSPEIIYQLTLQRILDTIVLDDKRLAHYATPFKLGDSGKSNIGHRDTTVITFDPGVIITPK